MSNIDQRFDPGLAESEHGARGVSLVEREEGDRRDAWEFADEARDGAQFLFSASRDRQDDCAGALIAEIVEDIL
jgi:hypothetical protein